MDILRVMSEVKSSGTMKVFNTGRWWRGICWVWFLGLMSCGIWPGSFLFQVFCCFYLQSLNLSEPASDHIPSSSPVSLSLLSWKLLLASSSRWTTSWPLKLASAHSAIDDHISSFFAKFLRLVLFVLSTDSTQQTFATESTC